MDIDEKNRRESLLAKYFTPGTPINIQELFAGRIDQIRRVLQVRNQLGQHVVLFGERGVGKTSLANIIRVISDPALSGGSPPPYAIRVICDTADNFQSIWKKVFQNILTSSAGVGFGAEHEVAGANLATLIGEKSGASEIANILRRIPGSLIVFDEFDRIAFENDELLFSDCIKAISDLEIPVTIMIVGVAENITQLIRNHVSIERCITQIPMPRMTNSELEAIVRDRFPRVEMTFDDNIPSTIARLSHGFPHYTHLLGLSAGRAALDRDSVNIISADIKRAVELVVKDAEQSTRDAYDDAVRSSHKDSLHEHVLLACALAPPDESGYFAATDVKRPMTALMHKPYLIPAFARHLSQFCEEKRGKILQRKGGPRRYKYRFSNPLMRTHVYLRGIKSGKIPNEYLDMML